MPDKPSLDPLGLWRDMVTQWERGVNEVANRAMGSDEFSRAMHQVTSLTLRMQQTMGEAMNKSLQALNLPSRADFNALHERIGRIEETLARLEVKIASPEAPAQAPPRPARTRQPPAS